MGQPGSAFSAGFNLLLSDPKGFFTTLVSKDASSVPAPEVQKVVADSQTGAAANFGAGLSELTGDPITFAGDFGNSVSSAVANTLSPIEVPTWVKWTIIAGLAVGGLVAIGFIFHEVRKI